MFDYTYSMERVGGFYNIDIGSLDKKITEASLPNRTISSNVSVCTVSFYDELSSGQKDTLDAIVIVEKADISILKTVKINAVVLKTQENEDLGVPYNNYRFSITPSAKSNWLAIVMVRDTLTYPFNAPTGFGSIYIFQDANDVLGFFGASMAYLQYWEQSDEQLIIAINACTTVEQINAIIDDRSYPPS